MTGIEPLALAVAGKVAAKFGPSLLEKWAAKLAVNQHDLSGVFDLYANAMLTMHQQIKTIVLRDGIFRLEDLYVPLTITTRGHTTPITTTALDDFHAPFFETHKRILVVDTAGMGKSTLVRFLLLRCIRNSEWIPLLLDLRGLDGTKPIWDCLLQQFCQLGEVPGKWDHSVLLSLVQSGKCIVFLDGYDEVTDVRRPAVTEQVQQFAAKAPECAILITSREHQNLAGLQAFQNFSINPLQFLESCSLIRKYAKARNEVDVGENLIAEIKKPEHSGVREFLSNPLLTSLLFAAYEYKHEVPLKRSSFYSQVFEALFDRHDLSKPGPYYTRAKASGLDRTDFSAVLSRLARDTLADQAFEYSEATLLNKYLPQVARAMPAIRWSQAGFLRDLRETVPLLVNDGGKLRWAHRSLQEYFAAVYVCFDLDGAKSEEMVKIIESSRVGVYTAMLDLCAELAPSEFRQSALRVVLSRLREHREMSRSAFRGAGISEEAINARAAITCLVTDIQILVGADLVWGAMILSTFR